MSFAKQLLVLLVVLLLTNAATFAFVAWRCHRELEDQQRLAATVAERATRLEEKLDQAEEELERLSVWGDFIRLQQDLNAIDAHINRLNFGNAISAIDGVAEEIRLGGYGELFRERRAELLPLLEEAERQLRAKREVARQVLVEFNDRAFEILSGISVSAERRPEARPLEEASPDRPETMDGSDRPPGDEPVDEIEETPGDADEEPSARDESPREAPEGRSTGTGEDGTTSPSRTEDEEEATDDAA